MKLFFLARGPNIFGQKLFNPLAHFLLQGNVELAAGRGGKSGVHGAHASVAS